MKGEKRNNRIFQNGYIVKYNQYVMLFKLDLFGQNWTLVDGTGTMKNDFDAPEILEEIRLDRKIRRKRSTWGRSKLLKYQAELYDLRKAGASLQDIQFWLKREKRMMAACSTIKRFLDKIISPKVE